MMRSYNVVTIDDSEILCNRVRRRNIVLALHVQVLYGKSFLCIAFSLCVYRNMRKSF